MTQEHGDGASNMPGQQLELLRWHIVRADNQRLGMWARAGACLSANALIITGAAIVASVSSSGGSASGGGVGVTGAVIAVLALLMSAFSIFEATKTFSGIYKWPREITEQPPRTGVLYQLSGTARVLKTFEGFHVAIATRSLVDEVHGAELEFWRLSLLQQWRTKALNNSVRYFLSSVSLVIVALSVIFLSKV